MLWLWQARPEVTRGMVRCLPAAPAAPATEVLAGWTGAGLC